MKYLVKLKERTRAIRACLTMSENERFLRKRIRDRKRQLRVVLIVCIVLRFLSGYLENYGSHEQQIILLHVYSSLDNVKQSASDSDSEGKKATIPF